MKVYKFGGASVKDAEGVRNVKRIMDLVSDEPVLIVVSAMGKTTNALERLCEQYVAGDPASHETFESIRQYHDQILHELFPEAGQQTLDDIFNSFVELEWMLEDEPHPDYDFNYDQIVSIGELVSSRILEAYLRYSGTDSKWIDSRGFIRTDNTYREGMVDWDFTGPAVARLKDEKPRVLVTQGFIGGTSENFTTTLGREGSDYSAAIFARGLQAESVTIWKDVPGVLNSDPKVFPNSIKYDEIPYSEALEMTYYGATVIHPKTIKPLQNSGIPLYVKPFLYPEEAGTCIHKSAVLNSGIPAIIIKRSQVLVSISARDYSFIDEKILSVIYSCFTDLKIKTNMMQVSALSFSCCIDADKRKFDRLLNCLNEQFRIRYNSGLDLITVRHFRRSQLSELLKDREVILEQFSRNTAQFVVRSSE